MNCGDDLESLRDTEVNFGVYYQANIQFEFYKEACNFIWSLNS